MDCHNIFTKVTVVNLYLHLHLAYNACMEEYIAGLVVNYGISNTIVLKIP